MIYFLTKMKQMNVFKNYFLITVLVALAFFLRSWSLLAGIMLCFFALWNFHLQFRRTGKQLMSEEVYF
jgi:hypothetical protein